MSINKVRPRNYIGPQGPFNSDLHLQLYFQQSEQCRIINFYRFLLNSFRSVNSLSKVLFIFPSQYLFAIGFPSIFSLGGSLSPDLGSNPKLPDSASPSSDFSLAKYGGFTLFAGLFQKALCQGSVCRMNSPAYNSPREARRFTA